MHADGGLRQGMQGSARYLPHVGRLIRRGEEARQTVSRGKWHRRNCAARFPIARRCDEEMEVLRGRRTCTASTDTSRSVDRCTFSLFLFIRSKISFFFLFLKLDLLDESRAYCHRPWRDVHGREVPRTDRKGAV